MVIGTEKITMRICVAHPVRDVCRVTVKEIRRTLLFRATCPHKSTTDTWIHGSYHTVYDIDIIDFTVTFSETIQNDKEQKRKIT